MSWKFLEISLLRDIDLFHKLGDRALNEVLAITSIERPKMGDLIFEEGSVGDALYIILDGEVRISKDIHGIGEEALAFLTAGSYFGEMALLEDASKRSANAIAGDSCMLGKIDRASFMGLLERDKQLAFEILWSFVNTLSRRLRESNEKIAFFALSNIFE
ncbi:MAG: cyclic nucleotide-binding domain-containing protein [Bradymonadaceae bacterium]|nr:cyclic nucleotide-binding domain-containing protein [Lujinxingiaceae bacterium]